MKRAFLLLSVLVCLAGSAFGQAARVDNYALLNNGSFVKVAAGAIVTVCTAAGTGQPCAPLATTYTSVTLGTTTTNTTPGLAAPCGQTPTTNPCTTDSNGNFGFWVAPGPTYIVTLTGAGLTAATYTITSTVTGSGNNSFTGINTSKSSDSVLYIGSGNPQGWTGSDIGAWLNAAYAALPSTGGRIRIASSATTYNMSTAFSATVAGKPVLIEGDPGGAVIINWTPTNGTAFTFDTRLNANQHPVGMGLRDLVLTTSGAVSSTGIALGSTNSAEGYEFQRLKIENFITGVAISLGGGNVSFANMFYNVVFRNLTFGIVGTGNSELTKLVGGSFFNVGTGISGAGDFVVIGTSCDDPGAGGCMGNAIITWVGGHLENPGGGLPTYVNSNGIIRIYGGVAWDDCIGAANPVAGCTATNSTPWFKNTGTDAIEIDGTELLSAGRAMATNPVVDFGATGVGTLRVYNKSSALLTPLYAASALTSNQVTDLSFNTSGTGVNVAAFQAWKVPENGGSAPAGVTGQIICYGDGTAHALKCSYNNDAFSSVARLGTAQTWTANQSFNSGTLLPSAAGGTDQGSASLPFRNLWLGTAATNNFKFQPAATSAPITVAMPDPGTNVNLAFNLTATSAAFATATTAATCVQSTTAVTGATTSMVAEASPVSTPGVGAVWSAFVSSAGNVTINECAVAASAGGSIAFNIRVHP